MILDTRASIIAVAYILAAVLLIFGLRKLSSPATARSGNLLAAAGVFLALAVTLLDQSIVSYWELALGIVVGGTIGVVAARKVQMTAMPQMVGLLNGLGGGTAALVSLSEYLRLSAVAPVRGGEAVSVVLGTAIGSVSFTGSVIAFAKLQELLSSKPFQFPLQRVVNALLLLAILALGATMVVGGDTASTPWIVFAVALALGAMLVLPIGGGDMPVVIATLNALTGIAAAFTGMVLHNQILVVAGILVGASGTLLTLLMGKAMNRSLGNVFFGAFGAGTAVATAGGTAGGVAKTVRQTSAEDTAIALAYARKVVIVPGYGLAVAEGQHAVRELAQELEKRGVDVKFAIHPVAGRMPGHMNVLLAEANIPYDELVEMDQINGDFDSTDVVLVVGANDVVNPAAREDTTSPIYGMPILDVDKARNVIVLKRSMGTGFAGIDNALFYNDRTRMLFGDAKKSLTALVEALKAV
ncbi:MAG TPA: NAD(P)(+) transhydrogenase (Re/Si-specific) subunit beta [Gemmatimonadaceae bacterium]|nr:NAD(P)(+) transhydrogenase (Re/Si-specific) subunit beta [Gemmatimonadaceae bacterium]